MAVCHFLYVNALVEVEMKFSRCSILSLLILGVSACGPLAKKSDSNEEQPTSPVSSDGTSPKENPSNPASNKMKFEQQDFTLADSVGELMVFQNNSHSQNEKSVQKAVLPQIKFFGSSNTPAIEITKYTKDSNLVGFRLYYQYSWGAPTSDAKAFNEKYGTDRTGILFAGAIGSGGQFELIMDDVLIDSVKLDRPLRNREVRIEAGDSRIAVLEKLYANQISRTSFNWTYKTQESSIMYEFSGSQVNAKVDPVKSYLISE